MFISWSSLILDFGETIKEASFSFKSFKISTSTSRSVTTAKILPVLKDFILDKSSLLFELPILLNFSFKILDCPLPSTSSRIFKKFFLLFSVIFARGFFFLTSTLTSSFGLFKASAAFTG